MAMVPLKALPDLPLCGMARMEHHAHPSKKIKMPMGLVGINNQLRTTLRTYPWSHGSSVVTSASGCSNLLLIKQVGA